ncbi:MAG TPA: DUF952 domain-containing protein [Devosiaceae bacterium]|jgi:uncharacterized protein (DUF952 family)
MPTPDPQLVYKVATRAAYRDAVKTGTYQGAPIDIQDGFIHFSTAGQLPETLSKHFAGQQELVLAAVPTEALGPALRWEVSRGGALFPHLYAPLSLSLVKWTAEIAVAPDGTCILPEDVR